MPADLFKEIIPSILQTKEYALLTEQDEKSYPSFIVNRALSFHRDTVLWANEMNRFTTLDNKLKYDFLINIIRASKRQFNKWHKKAQSRDLSVVKEYYGYSDAKAEEACKILSNDQITEMRKQLYKGD
jgi:hypothetical protein